MRHRSRAVLVVASAAAVVLAGCSDAAPESGAPSAPVGVVDGGATSGSAGKDPVDGTASASPTSPSPTDPGSTSPPSASGTPDDSVVTTAEPEVIELPRGGTEIFPEFRLFGYSGLPGSPGMGRLGIGDLDEKVEEMEERGEEYAGGRPILPVLELIATVVHPVPGADGMFRTYIPESVIQDHLDAARRHDGILLLNIQPGRADFIDEVKHYEKWLVEPDVGVALDPEWAVSEGQIPGRVYGSTTGAELGEVAAYLSGLVEANGLPEKVMVYHQVHPGVVRDELEMKEVPGVVVIKSVDGIGAPSDKIKTYNLVNETKPDFVVPGFKLFYEEDLALGPIMTGAEVLGLDPQPEYILFE